MRLLLITPSYPPMLGGGAIYASALARRLAEQGDRVTVLTTTARSDVDYWGGTAHPDAVEESQEGSIQVIRCGVASFPGGRAALLAWRKAMICLSAVPGDHSAALRAMARRVPAIPVLDRLVPRLGEYDLVHTFNLSWECPSVSAWGIARSRGLPLVITPFLHMGKGSQDRVARNNLMDHQLGLLRDADAVLTLTDIEATGLHHLGVERRRVHVVGGGLESPLPTVAEGFVEGVLEHYELTPPLILFVGRVSADKGALDAVRAMGLLQELDLDATLVLVGEQTPEFIRHTRRIDSPLSRAIRPLGIVDEQRKQALLAASTMLVLPSRADSFGIVLLEAWAHGKPVIGARAGGIPGVIRDGEDGLLVDCGDVGALAAAMAELLRDEQRAEWLGTNGQKKLATAYTWDHVHARHAAIYGQLAGDACSGGKMSRAAKETGW